MENQPTRPSSTERTPEIADQLLAERKVAEQRSAEAAERYECERERNQATEDQLLRQIDQLRQSEVALRKEALEAEKTHQAQTSELRARIEEERDARSAAQAKIAALETQVEFHTERLEALTKEIEAERKESHNHRARADGGEKVLAVKEAELATAKLALKDLNDQVRVLREEA